MSDENKVSVIQADHAKAAKSGGPSLYVRYLPILVLVLVSVTAITCAGIFMGHETLASVAMAVTTIPAILLIFFIYKRDAIESEPAGLLYLLFIAGMFATVPTILIKVFFENSLSPVVMTAALSLVEELAIYLVLYFVTWNHPAFNYRFDGVVYGATAAMGYEVALATLYLSGGLAAINLSRSAIPVHCIFGIYMGFFYGLAKAKAIEGDRTGSAVMEVLSLMLPVLLNLIYELFMTNIRNTTVLIVLIVFLVVLNLGAIISVIKFAKADKSL